MNGWLAKAVAARGPDNPHSAVAPCVVQRCACGITPRPQRLRRVAVAVFKPARGNHNAGLHSFIKFRQKPCGRTMVWRYNHLGSQVISVIQQAAQHRAFRIAQKQGQTTAMLGQPGHH